MILALSTTVFYWKKSLKELEEKCKIHIHFITSNAKAAQVIESLFQTKNAKITDEYNLYYLYDTVLPVARLIVPLSERRD